MTSFAIIVQSRQKVNPQYQKTTGYAQFVRPALTVPLPLKAQVATVICEAWDCSPHDATWSNPQLQDLDYGSKALPLTAEQVLFCTSQLGALGCSHAEMEQFFDDLLASSPYWYPNFLIEAAKYDKSPAFLFDVCDAFVDSITPIDDYVRIAGQLFRYQRDEAGYEFISCMGTRGGKVVELVAYPHEVQQVKQELVWV